jgi:hypothetical protein
MLVSAAFAESNWNLQAVDSTGNGTSPWLTSDSKVTVEGYILNRPEYMLDTTPNYNTNAYDVGGQWQIFIEGGQGDHAGTCIWMGQNYKNLVYVPEAFGRYTNDQWTAELNRLDYDPNTGHRFMPGDYVRVTGLTKFYGGKTNINERHSTDPNNDVIIELVSLGKGLPVPEIVTLSQLKDTGDNFIFDASRQTGDEYYQGRLIRINGVHFADASSWGPNGVVTVTDGARTFPIQLGIGPGIITGSNNLASTFDVIGILDQEGSNTGGYSLYVTNYDGNGLVLTDGCDLSGVFAPGDLNQDCKVDLKDFAILAGNWLKCTNGLLTNCQW